MNNEAPKEIVPDISLEPEVFDLREYLYVISRYKWGIIGLTGLVCLLAAIHVNSLTPIYRATSSLLIESQDENVVSIQQVYGANDRYYEYYQTQLGIIKSRNLAAKVVDKLNLVNHPDFKVATSSPAKDEPTGIWQYLPDFLSNLFKQKPKNPVHTKIIASTPRDIAIDRVLGMEDVTIFNDSHLFNISFDSADPVMAANLANALAEAYIDDSLEARMEMTKRASTWITDQLKGLKQKVDESEQALQDFLNREKLINANGVDTLAVKQLNDLSTQLVDAKRNRNEAQELYRQIIALDGQPYTAYESIPAVLEDNLVGLAKTTQSNAERKVSELAKRYGPKHPKMIAAEAELEVANKNLQTQIMNVVESVKKQYSLAQAEEAHVSSALDSTKHDLTEINKKSHELKTLEYDVNSNRQLYDMFLTRFKETTATDNLKATNARIVDHAVVPQYPYKPDKHRFLMIAFMLGLAGSLLLAFLIGKLDNTLNDSLQVENRLFIPVLSILPKLSNIMLKKHKAMRYYSEKTHSNFSENIRTIRTSILLNKIDNPKKVVLVTSSVPEEGKSIVSINLALSLGQMGSTLLIDGDMRKPSIAKVFDLHNEGSGLSYFIAGTSDLKNCITQLGEENIYVMPAGQIPSNPLELLSSSRFEKALNVCKEKFDYIVIDSAPTVPVSDPVVLSRLVDSTIYVIKAGSTPYQLAKAGLKKLRQVDANLIGVVLNQVNPARKPGKYGHYESDYYSYYGYGKT